MSKSLEIEKTFLCSEVPHQLISGVPAKLVDVYIPEGSAHPQLRLRQKGERYEITKKTPIDNDPSRQMEETISLTPEEFHDLSRSSLRTIEKYRFPITYKGHEGELDIFGEKHAGLILVDFEFENPEDHAAFEKPSFCHSDVTHEDAIAGGILSGLESNELFSLLADKYGYKPAHTGEIEELVHKLTTIK